MTPKQRERFLRDHVVPLLPGWAVRGNEVYVSEDGPLHRAVLLNRWRYDDEHHSVEAYVASLAAPWSGTGMTFSHALTRDWSVERGSEAAAGAALAKLIRQRGMPWLNRIADAGHMRRARGADLEHQREATAYALLLAGRHKAADAELGGLLAMLDAMREDEDYGRDRSNWWNVMWSRVVKRRRALAADPVRAAASLRRAIATNRRRLSIA